ncbi:PadR family transcriptional regulator [Amycolatopsis sp. YIM 10]|uniref:PadR family transcriptional regulator n=1 Tax=Amycolatopsis sp. YIM 10 TaxID=2653857 RepID=UPI0012905EC1|nr:PadR family transcriptional regulator [Amycolatopsis sp. YIM 10]QFU86150.1 Transcriptional regulator PadR-like family protein [Amycolatopsis sp. YIM 10]
MSATRLLVLGVVRISGRAHGYQVRRELLNWRADSWANVQPGSIYHALKKMAAEELLEEVSTESGRGPDRVAYQLTEAGEREFYRLLTGALTDADITGHLLSAGIVLMPMLERARAVELLKLLEVRLEGATAETAHTAEHAHDWGHPPHVVRMYGLWGGLTETVRSWVHDLVAALEAGEYRMADDHEPTFPINR